ncbi:MAG: MFS transporter [Hydrotalea flava]|uniref:MFS transporter n=1 Tax=Hydrotalea TaxID=1004300 RepID=UPI0009438FE8|nr:MULTISPECIES: MFS transporter [Hydrotalea]MBY0349034.1 MFS transporter [Hydrotalea flava]NIM33999.1 MFS transporter [Hydrotalea flava]NIM36828.1 MFS transporter [Hydrotalea flava]NIN02013.1 MFS transporter [Hydrotalea flava]NIN13672.1 MFS transporter [Hydrotalea flava]
MYQWRIKLSIFINYFVFAILLNSVGTVILQVQNNYGVTQSAAAVLEPFKDLSIAIVSFIISSFITKIGYKKSMLIALAFISLVCFSMPYTNSFFATKLLFAAIGSSFALIKISVYSTIGLVTRSEKEHISLMNFVESFFMVGILAGYFIFSYFVNDKDPHSTAWLKVYVWLGACTTFAFILLLSARLDESKAQQQVQKISLAKSVGEMFQLIVSPIVLIFIACAFFYVLIEQSIMSWLPTFNSQVLKLPTTLSIEMASILAGSTAAGRFLAGLVLKKLNWFTALFLCLILATILVLVAIPLAQKTTGQPITGWATAPIAAFIFPMIGLLIAPIYPAINSVILSTLSVEKQGVMSGLIIIFSALGGTTGSLITGNIFQYYGGTQAFYFSLVPITILALCLFIFRKLQLKYKQQQSQV